MEIEDAKGPSNGLQQEQSKEVVDFHKRLQYLRKAVVVALFFHIVVTVVVMSMGYSLGGEIPGGDGETLYYSPSIVFFGFGCLNTCVFAAVETWNVLDGTKNTSERSFPSWHWHNDSFLKSVGNMFFLSLFMLPALVVYMLHGYGREFFGVLREQKTANPQLFSLILAHIFLGFFVFFVDGLTIMRQTRKLRTFQEKEDDEEDGEAVEEEDDDEDEDDTEDQLRPITIGDKNLSYASIFFHFLFEIDLILIATRKANSGTTGAVVIFGGFLLLWIYFAIKYRDQKDISESWLLNHRLGTIAHLFTFLCLFWVALGVLLFQETLGTDFFDTLGGLDGVDEFLCIFLLLLFFAYLAVYFVILYVHSRSMRALDEIGSLMLAAELQAKLRA
jgi:hypothetical protein